MSFIQEPLAADCLQLGLCGEGLRQLCISVTCIKMKRWWQSTKHWTDAAQNIRYFMKTKWISISIPKSVRTDNRADNKTRDDAGAE